MDTDFAALRFPAMTLGTLTSCRGDPDRDLWSMSWTNE